MKLKLAVSMIAFLLVATLGAFLVRAQNQAAPAQKTVVLRGGLLIDGNGGAPVNNAVVVMSGGKIQSVGTVGSVTIPAGATVIDTTGKTIMPGLFESHAHLRNFQASSYLYWGVTTIADMGNHEGWLLAYRDAVESGRQVGPHILAVGGKFNHFLLRDSKGELIEDQPTTNGDMNNWKTVTEGNGAESYAWDPASAAKAVAYNKSIGLNAVKLYTRVPPDMMKMIITEAHKVGLPVLAHYTSGESVNGLFTGTDEILDTGLDVHVHMMGLIKATAPKDIVDRIANGENLTQQANASLDTSKYPPLIQKMVQVHMFLNPTLSAQFGNGNPAIRDAIGRINAVYVASPMVTGLPPGTQKQFAAFAKAPEGGRGGRGGRGAGGNAAANEAQVEEGYRRVGLFVKEFVDAGGKVEAGSDSNGGTITPGLKLDFELQLLHDVGLTPMQVIQAATKWAAEAWRQDSVFGSVEVGKRADVLVLNRNPLDDMMAVTDVFQVIQSGNVIDRASLVNYKETVPKPSLIDNGIVNPLIDVPFVDRIAPELLTTNGKKGTEITLTGEHFTKDSKVLLSDRLLATKSEAELTDKHWGAYTLTFAVPSDILKKPGMYMVAVVNPGNQGGVSNMGFLYVEP